MVYIPETDVEGLDQLVANKQYANRNEAIRFAIKDLLIHHRDWRQPDH